MFREGCKRDDRTNKLTNRTKSLITNCFIWVAKYYYVTKLGHFLQ